MNNSKPATSVSRYLMGSVLLICFLTLPGFYEQVLAQQSATTVNNEGVTSEKTNGRKSASDGPVDEYNRGNPRSSVKQFIKATRDGDYERAAKYLDFRNLPSWMDESDGPQIARQLKILLERTLVIDPELVSDHPDGNLKDGQHASLESIGHIKDKVTDRSFNILLQHVPRDDGVYIWKFSNRTVADIPEMYRQFGYRPFEEKLSGIFPDITFLGWHMWQWVMFLLLAVLAFLAALLVTWLLRMLINHKQSGFRNKIAQLFRGPLRIIIFFLLLAPGIHLIGPSTSIRSILQAGTLWTAAVVWALIRTTDLLLFWWGQRLQEGDEEKITILLRPVRNILAIIIILMAILVWLSNIGFNVSALLTGLGVGGIAVALAAQDTLKNFFASIMILLDKPYRIGHRILVKGHDGLVEEIGLRSTKMRLLNGHQTIIPNDQMANLDIENIGRRPHIRRLINITIRYDTPPDKIEQAVNIIRNLLENHEGMDPAFPPRVYFNEFNRESLNIVVFYWYHPNDYWNYLKFSQKINLEIVKAFKKEDIKFAFPTSATYLAQDEGQAINVNLSGNAPPAGKKRSHGAANAEN